MNQVKKKLPYGTGLGAWVCIDAERKPMFIVFLCVVHAVKWLLYLKGRQQKSGPGEVDEIRIIRKSGGGFARQVLSGLEQIEKRGENNCALCQSPDGPDMEVWEFDAGAMMGWASNAWPIDITKIPKYAALERWYRRNAGNDEIS